MSEIKWGGKKNEKTIALILVVLLLFCALDVLLLVGCLKKHEVYDIDTELGDHLSVEVYLSETMFDTYLNYRITDNNSDGYVWFWFKDQTEMPKNPIATFATIGSYGNTNFYLLKNELIYVYNNERIYFFPHNYDLDQCMSELSSNGNEYTEMRREVMTDLIKTDNFDYIYQFGTILAYEKSDDMKLLLERYADGNFSDEEKQINADSSITEADMTVFAKNILETYYAD